MSNGHRNIPLTMVVAVLAWLMPCGAFAMLHAQQGRFMQRDPLGYVDGMSAYQYVRTSPESFVDPTGTIHVRTSIETAGDIGEAEKLLLEPFGTVYMREIDDMIRWIDRDVFIAGDRFHTPLRFDPKSTEDDQCTYCMDKVIVSGHGGPDGMIVGRRIIDRFSFVPGKDVPPEIKLLLAIKAKLCEKATVQFVICYSDSFRGPLQSLFGPNVNLWLYKGSTSWGVFGAGGEETRTW